MVFESASSRRVVTGLAIAAGVAIVSRAAMVMFEADSLESQDAVLLLIVVAIWLAPAAWALGSRRSDLSLVSGAALSVYAALWMLVGDPDLDDGGQWFLFVLVIYYAPVASATVLINVAKRRRSVSNGTDASRNRRALNRVIAATFFLVAAMLLYLVGSTIWLALN